MSRKKVQNKINTQTHTQTHTLKRNAEHVIFFGQNKLPKAVPAAERSYWCSGSALVLPAVISYKFLSDFIPPALFTSDLRHCLPIVFNLCIETHAKASVHILYVASTDPDTHTHTHTSNAHTENTVHFVVCSPFTLAPFLASFVLHCMIK